MNLSPPVLIALLALLPLATGRAADPGTIAVLTYHRFHPTTAAAATVVTTPVFAQQMDRIAAQGVPVLKLRVMLDLPNRPAHAPPHAVVITADDGFRSVYTEMFPILRRHGFTATLFINPPAIGAGAYLTWAQIAEMRQSGLIEIEPHTLSHPDFRAERARRTPGEFIALVSRELAGAREMLRDRLGTEADILAWPYGIHDPELEAAARQAGYIAAFALGGRAAVADSPAYALPRYQVYEADQGPRFAAILAGIPRRQ